MKFANDPLDELICTQKFGERSEYYSKYKMKGHNGVDFRTRFPDTPQGRREVYAVMDGEVSNAELDIGYGNYVRLVHLDGSQTVYAHFYLLKVKKGQRMKSGEVLGISDSTGDSSDPHLHFGYRPSKFDVNNGYKGYIDPEPFFIKFK